MSRKRRKARPPRHWGRFAMLLFMFAVVLFLITPLLFVIPMSLGSSRFFTFPPAGFPSLMWYERFFTSRSWLEAGWTTLCVSALSAVLATLLGVPASVGLMRCSVAGKRLVQALMVSPIMIPVIVLAVAQFLLWLRLGLLDTLAGLVLAYAVLGLPFVFISVSAGLARADPSLERAAMNLGCTRFGAFVRVTLPLIRGSIVVGMFLAFMTSFNEVVVAIFLTDVKAVTLPKRMWDGIRFEIDPTLTAVSTILVVFSLVACIAFARRQVEPKSR